MAVRVIVPILLGILLVACSSASDDAEPSPTPRPTVNSVSPVARLNDAGFVCSPTPVIAETYVASQAVCQIESEQIEVYTFKDDGAKRNWYAAYDTITCVVFKGQSFYVIDLGVAAIAPTTQTLANKIAAALDAEVTTINC